MSPVLLTWAHPAFEGLMGVGRRDVTPPPGIYARNWGAAAQDIADGVHKPLLCTVLTMRASRADRPLVLAALDATWFRGPEGAVSIREHVCRELKVPDSALMIALSHTHAGPSISPAEADKPGGAMIGPYVERVADSIVEAACEALACECLAELTVAAGRCGLAADRDLQDPESPRLVCGFNPSVRADDTCLVGRVSAKHDGATFATLVNYACHPTTLGAGNRKISPDFVGAMRETVEAGSSGAKCLFLQGASGELAPRLQYTDDLTVADAHGRELGHVAAATLEGMLPPGKGLAMQGVVESGAPLAMWRLHTRSASAVSGSVKTSIELPLKPTLRGESQVALELSRCDDRAGKERLHRELLVARTVGAGAATSKRPVWIWLLGDILFVGHSDEAYSLAQIELRAAYPDLAIIFMNVVNGWGGYLCPAVRYQQRVYQSQQSPYAAGCLELFVSELKRSIDALLAHAGTPRPSLNRHHVRGVSDQ
ncbi:MAG: hypothetical protein JSR77_15920 [Planctomycetes bacterium]|nr:hypothetical protein [Planctomycetota bacterium]